MADQAIGGQTDDETGPGVGNRFQALLFVIAAFVCWFLFQSLARIVIRCAPNACSISSLPQDLVPKVLRWPDATILIVTLIVAIWAARRMVFPRED